MMGVLGMRGVEAVLDRTKRRRKDWLCHGMIYCSPQDMFSVHILLGVFYVLLAGLRRDNPGFIGNFSK